MLLIFASGSVFQTTEAADPTVVFLTSGTSWTVPADWNDSDNTIEVIGGGGGGGVVALAPAGGGAYSKISNLALTPASAGVPDEDFSVPDGDAEFGYSVVGVTDATTVDDSFKINAGTCGSGSNVSNKCWFNKTSATTSEQIIDASSATAGTGATSSVVFQVTVGANPVPAVETGNYQATVTLTAVMK